MDDGTKEVAHPGTGSSHRTGCHRQCKRIRWRYRWDTGNSRIPYADLDFPSIRRVHDRRQGAGEAGSRDLRSGVRLVHRLHGYGARIHVQRFHHRRDRPRTDGMGDAGPGGRAELEQLIPKLEK